MSRATPDLTQGFTGVSLPKTGPRQMGTDAEGRTSVITFLNMVTESMASLHDDQTETRPDYLPVNGIWCYTDPDGAKSVYQYDGTTDVLLWTIAEGSLLSGGLPGIVCSFSGTFGGPDGKHPINRKTGVADLSYALCDGGTYTAPDGAEVTTPDLRDRFVVGAGDTFAKGDAGGSTEHNHTGTVAATTLSTAQMPSHRHGGIYRRAQYSQSTSAAYSAYFESGTNPHYTGYKGDSGSHTHGLTVTGGGSLPPYYALAFIMQL